MPETSNITTGKPKPTGPVFLAPAGTVAPIDATTALADTYKSLGYASDDGVTNEISRDTKEIKAWGGETVLRPQTSYGDKFTTTLIESMNVDVLKATFGSDNVTGTLADGIVIKSNSTELPYGVWVFEMITNGGNYKRIVIPQGKVTDVGKINYSDSDAVGYELTITALPDSSGNTHYEYIAKPK